MNYFFIGALLFFVSLHAQQPAPQSAMSPEIIKHENDSATPIKKYPTPFNSFARATTTAILITLGAHITSKKKRRLQTALASFALSLACSMVIGLFNADYNVALQVYGSAIGTTFTTLIITLLNIK
jgi:hypothetical protein